MEVILKVKRGKATSVIAEIKKHSRKFTKIKHLKKYNDFERPSITYVVVTYSDDHLLSDKGANQLKKKYESLSNVTDITVNQAINAFKENISDKNCHFVFDVDSTLTKGRGTIQNKVRNIFAQMNASGHRVYLASGRNEAQLRQDMDNFNTERFGIAENGGIIIGMGSDGHLILGNRTEPDKVLQYMKKHCKKITEDVVQGIRITERIFDAVIKESKFLNYVKKSNANVEVLASKNSYHVVKKKINKGYALERLSTELRFGNDDVVIGVGDSDLDVPLFGESVYKFAVGNASPKAKKTAIFLSENYADGVQEMYQKWFKQ